MDKFCALGLSLLLCLSGCKDFTKKNRIFKVDKKKLIDGANHRGLTNLETLGMTLDLTTRDQAIEILNSRGYTVILFEIGILEKVGLAELQEKSLKKWFEKELPSAELLGDGIKSLHD